MQLGSTHTFKDAHARGGQTRRTTGNIPLEYSQPTDTTLPPLCAELVQIGSPNPEVHRKSCELGNGIIVQVQNLGDTETSGENACVDEQVRTSRHVYGSIP